MLLKSFNINYINQDTFSPNNTQSTPFIRPSAPGPSSGRTTTPEAPFSHSSAPSVGSLVRMPPALVPPAPPFLSESTPTSLPVVLNGASSVSVVRSNFLPDKNSSIAFRPHRCAGGQVSVGRVVLPSVLANPHVSGDCFPALSTSTAAAVAVTLPGPPPAKVARCVESSSIQTTATLASRAPDCDEATERESSAAVARSETPDAIQPPAHPTREQLESAVQLLIVRVKEFQTVDHSYFGMVKVFPDGHSSKLIAH